jgi:hypothetical protein
MILNMGYADDLAVVVDSKEDIQKVFDAYGKFSTQSGLFLNADKTEILNMRNWLPDENITIKAYRKEVSIKMVEEVKICGKTSFMLSKAKLNEHTENQIQKISKNIKMWEKRNLSQRCGR